MSYLKSLSATIPLTTIRLCCQSGMRGSRGGQGRRHESRLLILLCQRRSLGPANSRKPQSLYRSGVHVRSTCRKKSSATVQTKLKKTTSLQRPSPPRISSGSSVPKFIIPLRNLRYDTVVSTALVPRTLIWIRSVLCAPFDHQRKPSHHDSLQDHVNLVLEGTRSVTESIQAAPSVHASVVLASIQRA